METARSPTPFNSISGSDTSAYSACAAYSACSTCTNNNGSAAAAAAFEPPPLTATMPSTAKRTRGPDKKPRKKRGTATQVQEAPTATEISEGDTTGVKEDIVTKRALAAAREAAMDKNVTQGN